MSEAVTHPNKQYLWLFLPASLLVWGLALFWGPTATPPALAAEYLFSANPSPAAAEVVSTILRFRLPVLIQAFLCGGILAVSGAVLQALLQNPLAEPFVLGVSSGSALGIVSAAMLGLAGFWSRTGLSFLAGSASILVILAVARFARQGLSTTTIILSGVILNALLSAMTMFIQSLLGPLAFRNSVGLLMGRISLLGMDELLPAALLTLPLLVYVYARNAELDILSLGIDNAATTGVAVGREMRRLLIICALLTAVAVSLCGVIGFVGLIAPHAVRFLCGEKHRSLLPLSFLVGGNFLVLAATLANSLLEMTRIPLGTITALIGAPVFLYILIRHGRQYA